MNLNSLGNLVQYLDRETEQLNKWNDFDPCLVFNIVSVTKGWMTYKPFK